MLMHVKLFAISPFLFFREEKKEGPFLYVCYWPGCWYKRYNNEI